MELGLLARRRFSETTKSENVLIRTCSEESFEVQQRLYEEMSESFWRLVIKASWTLSDVLPEQLCAFVEAKYSHSVRIYRTLSLYWKKHLVGLITSSHGLWNKK